MESERLKKALGEIDRFNSQDPRREIVDGVAYPQELIYSKRLTEFVLNLNPEHSEALLIAARCQHICRWTIPRENYPMGRGGYLRWRQTLKSFHAEKVGEILQEVGYEEDFIAREQRLILKKNLKKDADTRTLEDALCLVFLETQFVDLMEKTPQDKMKVIVRKTWKKMSPKGREVALQMKLPFEEKRFLEKTLSAEIYGLELARLLEQTRSLRDAVVSHGIYTSIENLDELRIFMEHHVFAVWDFMSLVKSLQRTLTCTSVPWVPRGDPLSRRLINEITLDEESDESEEGGYLSHFELYLQAMEQCGADTTRVKDLIGRIQRGEDIRQALRDSKVPGPARAFVEKTWEIVESQSPHNIAAALTLGREDVIPEMFQNVLKSVENQFPGKLAHFTYYLERHIQEDADRHGPMAIRMLVRLCGGSPEKWQEALEAAQIALQARRELLDAVAQKMTQERKTSVEVPTS